MANSIWQATIQNEAGDIIPGAEITVTDEDTGLPATIFSSIGGAAKSNPFFADSNGFAQFYAGPGTYRVNAEDTGTGQSQLWRYIRFGDAASRDVGTSAGQIPDSNDLSMVGATENYTDNNLNPNEIGGTQSNTIIGIAIADTATTAKLILPHSLIVGNSITATGLFEGRLADGTLVSGGGGVTLVLDKPASGQITINVGNLSGLTTNTTSVLISSGVANSFITVNQ